MPRSKAQTGAWGVLLVQQQLLDLGIDSAQMTTDTGIDLLAYDNKSKTSFSIQVKTRAGAPNERRPDWKVKCHKCEDADLYAFVLQGKDADVWYIGQQQMADKLVAQGSERALTFYREEVPRRRRVPMACAYKKYKGQEALERFMKDWRSKHAIKVLGKAASR